MKSDASWKSEARSDRRVKLQYSMRRCRVEKERERERELCSGYVRLNRDGRLNRVQQKTRLGVPERCCRWLEK
jgi:hypothetical protein